MVFPQIQIIHNFYLVIIIINPVNNSRIIEKSWRDVIVVWIRSVVLTPVHNDKYKTSIPFTPSFRINEFRCVVVHYFRTDTPCFRYKKDNISQLSSVTVNTSQEVRDFVTLGHHNYTNKRESEDYSTH